MEPQFAKLTDLRSFELAPGVTGRPLFGEGAMINVIDFGAGATVAAHSHPHEQLGIVLRGMQVLIVDGVEHRMGPMDGYVLPGHGEPWTGGVEEAVRRVRASRTVIKPS